MYNFMNIFLFNSHQEKPPQSAAVIQTPGKGQDKEYQARKQWIGLQREAGSRRKSTKPGSRALPPVELAPLSCLLQLSRDGSSFPSSTTGRRNVPVHDSEKILHLELQGEMQMQPRLWFELQSQHEGRSSTDQRPEPLNSQSFF